MREKTYWRLVSLSPLVIPLVLFFGPELRNSLIDSPNTPASVGQIFSLGTLFIAGIPYILFLVIMQSFIWSKPKRWDRISSLLSPPLFLLVFLAGFQIYWSITAKGSWLDSPRAVSRLFHFGSCSWLSLCWVCLVIFGHPSEDKDS